jgi:Erv1 / Alr family
VVDGERYALNTMDVAFWGPSGWQLFHLIAEGSPTPLRTLVHLSRILPCKYCRESTAKYVSDHPLTKGMNAGKWLFDIHNKVNHKLTTQAETDPKVILPEPNPSYDEVHKKYADLLHKSPHNVPGRDFLFSVAYNYPNKPELDDVNTQQVFIKSLAVTYPFPQLRTVVELYLRTHPIALKSRSAYLHWMYGLLHRLSVKTNSPIRSFKGYTHHVAYYKAGCNKPTYHGKTCRRLGDGSYTKQRDHKRTRRIAVGGLLA